MDELLPYLRLVVVIATVYFSVLAFRKLVSPEVPGPNGERPYGVRGWLAFFVFYQAVMSPFLTVNELNLTLTKAETQYPSLLSLPGWTGFRTSTFAVTILTEGWQCWVGYQLWRRRVPRSVAQARILLIAMPVALAAGEWIASRVFLGTSPTSFFTLEIGLLASAPQLLYLYLSARVRNTYGLVRTRSPET